jgi:hypothetical protein
VSTVVTATLPGASGTLVTDGDSGGVVGGVPSPGQKDLSIRLSTGDTVPIDPARAQFFFADRGWRAGLASGLIGQQDATVVSYHVTDASGVVPGGAENEYSEVIRIQGGTSLAAEPSNPPIATAKAQLDSNVATLQSLAPAGTYDSITSPRIDVDPSTNSYAYAVTLQSSKPVADLVPELGNVLNGLQTGLVGNEQPLIDGLSIVLKSNGQPIAGSWINARTGEGTELFDGTIDIPNVLNVTGTFPNLTGGPPTAASVTSQPGSAN